MKPLDFTASTERQRLRDFADVGHVLRSAQRAAGPARDDDEDADLPDDAPPGWARPGER